MWFVLALITIVFWGGSDLFSKLGSASSDKYSHWKIVMAVGTVMGIHATAMLIFSKIPAVVNLFPTEIAEQLFPADFSLKDVFYYFPAAFCYIFSMILGYVGLRYLMLSVSSPICNSSGAIACILCLIFLKEMPDTLTWVGIVLVTIGVICLAFIEKKTDAEIADLSKREENKKYKIGFIAVFFPIFYCLIDGIGTTADALLLFEFDENTGEKISGFVSEANANIAYEYMFLLMAIFACIYVFAIKKEKVKLKNEKAKIFGALCETAGQFSYIYAIGDQANVAKATPMISAYCVFSVLLSRIFLKEKLSVKHYLVIFTVFAGIICMGIAEGIAEL